MTSELAILVISCDRYSDAWPPFFALLRKYWPDCPYPVYLGTNELSFNVPGVRVLAVGEDFSWSDSVRKMLERISEKCILMFFEDFFLASRMDGKLVAKCLDLMILNSISFIKIYPVMKSRIIYKGDAAFVRVRHDDDYCINTGLSLWNKDILVSLLKPGYTAWDFEVRNSAYCRACGELPGPFLSVRTADIKIRNGIWRGKWVPSSVRFCRRLGIPFDVSKRPLMDSTEVLWEYAKVWGKKILSYDAASLLKQFLIRLGFGHRFVTKE